jgi:hypothetical protein
MADYGSRIASLNAEQARLAQRQSELAAQRREEVGRLGVLETEDTVFTGLFLELKAAIASCSARLAQWRDAGFRFRCGKSERQRGTNAPQNPHGAGPDRDA